MSKQHKPLVERAGLAVFWSFVFSPLKILLPFLSSIVVVRLFRIENFSLFNITLALLDTLGLFVDLGIERTLPRFYPEVEMRYGRAGIVRLLSWVAGVKAAILLALVLALTLFPGFWIARFGLGAQGGWLLALIGVLLVLGAASDVSFQLLYTHFRQKATNLLDILAAVVRPTLTISFVLLGWGVLGALLALLITTVVSVAISLWLAWQVLRALPDEVPQKAAEVKRPSTRSLRDRIMSFAGLNYLINWSVYLYDLDFVNLMIPFLVVSSAQQKLEIAVISLAYKSAKEFLRALVIPLTGVQTPLFARLYAEGRIAGLRTAYATMTKFLILGLLPTGVGLIVAARNVLTVMYGQLRSDSVLTQFTLPTVVACTAILALGLFGEAIISVALSVLMVYEEFRVVMLARSLALLSIPMMLWLVPQYGAVGAAIAVAVAALASRLAALGYALRRLGLPFPGRFFTRVGTASLVMGFGLLPFLAFLPNALAPTILMVASGSLIFVLAFKAMGGIDREDKERFRTLRIPFIGVALRFL